jgi:RNase H-fold protein (predicted Holliday junction resolvase)
VSEQSAEIDKLAGALAKAQGKITGALKDSANPFFKSKYADLASVWDACRASLSENELAVIQTTESDDSGVFVTTTLAHSSGQWVRSRLRLTPKDGTPQGMGSAITYGRRYALAAIVGVAQVDDDGNAASGRAGTVTDPKGEPEHRSNFDVAERDKYVSRFTDAFNMDGEELEIAKAVESIHKEIAHRHDLYIAVGEELGTKKNAIRKYIDMLKKQKAAA